MRRPGGFFRACASPTMKVMVTIYLDNASGLAADLYRMIAQAKVVVGFTGAGISTESGVPDFRSLGSPWLRNKPISFEAFLSSAETRREAWRRKFAMDDL
jgi:NAD-dependent deacetylase